MFTELWDKTILSSLFSPSYTILDLNNSTLAAKKQKQKKRKKRGGRNEFRGIKLRMESIFVTFGEFVKMNSTKIIACEYFCSLCA